MRKVDFVHAVQEIARELKAKDVVAFLTPIVDKTADAAIPAGSIESFATLVFAVEGGYRDLQRREPIAQLLKELNVERLLSPATFSQLITIYSTAGRLSGIYNQGQYYSLFFSLYDFMKWLLSFETTLSKFLGESGTEPLPQETKILELEIVDFDETGVDINRVQELLGVLEDLRMRLTIVLALPESRLKVRYVESGTSIHIHVEGLGEVVESARKFFTDIWTILMNRKFERIDRRNATIEGDFELIDKIQQRVVSGTISEEDGEVFKQRILDDAKKLINSGTILEDAQAIEPVSKQKLLAEARDIRLLGTGDSSEQH